MKIAIIGAGPAGIYTALFLSDFEGEVHLFEQNKDIGEKLKTTGGGRMNVTNKFFTQNHFSAENKRFIDQLFKNPHFENRYKIPEKLGIEYKWEKNRAILRSEDAIKEVARLKSRLQSQSNCTLHLNTKIHKVTKNEEGFHLNIEESSKPCFFDKIILTSGGMYRMKDLGPAEKIYNLPMQLGHTITPLSPSLGPLIFKDQALRKLSGISFVGTLTAKDKNQSVTDDLLLTHFGISGPAALDFSALGSTKIELSFLHEVTENEFRNKFNALRQGKNAIKKFLKGFMPNRIVDFHLEKSEITQNFMADVPKQKLQILCQNLFHYPIPTPQKNSYPSTWTTRGGIDLSEVKTKNLESKIVPGCYFAGEILDLNGLCGGYNISLAMISAQIVADDLMNFTATPSFPAPNQQL